MGSGSSKKLKVDDAVDAKAASRPSTGKSVKKGGSSKSLKSEEAPLKKVASKKSNEEVASTEPTPEKKSKKGKKEKGYDGKKVSGDGSDATPFWERGPSDFRPTSSRPVSQSGKLLVYKTEKQKMMEEQARQARAASGDMPSYGSSRPGSALPPLADRKKLSPQAKQMTGDVRASNGGAAWAMEL